MRKKYKNIKFKGIYKITNKNNNKIYIGSSKDIFNRWCTHLHSFLEGNSNSKFKKDINKYGFNFNDFSFEVLKVIDESTEKRELLDIEQSFIEKFDSINNGYNISRAIGRSIIDVKCDLIMNNNDIALIKKNANIENVYKVYI